MFRVCLVLPPPWLLWELKSGQLGSAVVTEGLHRGSSLRSGPT